MGLSQSLFNLGVVEARTGPRRSVGDSERQRRRVGDMLLQLNQINLVERVGHGMVVEQVVVLLLVRDERRHALQQEIEVVGAPTGVGGERSSVELLQRSDQGCTRVHDVASSAH